MKWKILLRVLPLTLLFGLAKLGMHRLGWEFWTFDSMTGALFAAVSFVITFLLSGTLSDYKDSADMTMQLVNAFESIEDTNALMAKVYPEYDSKPLTKELATILGKILDWLKEGGPLQEVEDSLEQINSQFVGLQQTAGFAVVNRVQTELAKVRIMIVRIQSIKSTEFLGAAYVLLGVFLVGAIIALLLVDSNLFSKDLVVSCFLFTLFCYLLLLILDLDNPFQYDQSSCIDVDLSPLEVLRRRFQERLSPK
jgi:hypothetical protein